MTRLVELAAEFAATLGSLELLRPAWLLALLPLAWLWRRLARRPASAGGWSAVVDARLLPFVTRERTDRGGPLAPGMLAAGFVAATIALAGPALPGRSEFADRSDALRVLVVDLSPSMTAGEGGGERLERVRLKLLDLLQRLPPGQTALVVYAEEPYLVAPPTTDAATLALLVPELAPDAMPVAGNRPERALRMAIDLLARSGAKQRDLLWITAGGGAGDEPSRLLAALGPGALRPTMLDASADAADHAAATDVPDPEDGLVRVALRSDDADVRAIAARLDGGEKTLAERPSSRPRELGVWLLPLLLPLAALAFRRGVLLALALPLCLVPAPTEAADLAALWLRADQQARRLLDAGDAERAAALFADPRWRAVAQFRAGRYADAAALLAAFDDPDSHYNRGNALVRLDRFDEALDAYEAALKRRPADADALNNRDVVRRLLEQRRQANRGGSSDGTPDGAPRGDPGPRQAGAAQAAPDGGDSPASGGDRGRAGTTGVDEPQADAAGVGANGGAAADAGARSGKPPVGRGAAAGQAQRPDTTPTTATASDPRAAGASTAAMHDGSPRDAAPQAPEPGLLPPATPRPAASSDAADGSGPMPRGRSDPQREAGLLAEQWLRRVPDEPAGLLRRKLVLEHRRREAGEIPRPWQ